MLDKLFPDPSLKKAKWSIPLDPQPEIYAVSFVCRNRGLPKFIETKIWTTFSSCKVLLKKKRGLEYSHCFIFCMIFEEHYFSLNIPFTD